MFTGKKLEYNLDYLVRGMLNRYLDYLNRFDEI